MSSACFCCSRLNVIKIKDLGINSEDIHSFAHRICAKPEIFAARGESGKVYGYLSILLNSSKIAPISQHVLARWHALSYIAGLDSYPEEFHLFAIIQAAGWPIYLLLIASIIALALILERTLSLRRQRILPKTLLDEVIRVYHSGKIKQEVIDQLSNNSPLGKVLAAGLRNVNAPRDVMKESIEEAGRGVAHELERFLTTIGTIASLAPLMGLFGTVVGMIEIFGSQTAAGANPAQLAHGISVALYNTGFGLLIAMPALIFYRHFRALVDSLVVDMEQQAVKFVDTVHNARK